MPRPDASQRLAATKPKDGPSRGLIGGIIAAVIVVIVVVAVFVTQANKSGSYSGPVPTGGTSDAKGLRAYPSVKLKSNAPTVDIYEDFQCPICKELEDANGTKILADAKSGKIKLVWHLVTFLEQNNNNAPSSTIAANGLYCAADEGKGAEYHKANFAGQPQEGVGYTIANIKKFGKQAGITGAKLTKFNTCVDKRTYGKYVKATADNAGKDGVTSTPTVLINGKEVKAGSADYGNLLQTKNSWDKILAKYTK
ncbi:DsbA family protein [Flexivirga oryzae]|uniref:Protein-disulfide isomerase n=1 Tax=Flexivirga oryzae TaxID=1794944 RepID=A0A839N817_9MICO|nr:thioredoxin domain-containing protein [Flexivirga oryzae]MBB2890891.1 protein-disulfide isomerase [Flexivirga oryzae]